MINREEKSIRHVAVIAKFLDNNKPENVTYKVNPHFFRLHRSSSVSFNLSNVG